MRLGPAAAAALAIVLLSAAPARAETWGAPFRVAGPMATDLLPAQLAFAPSGAAAFGFTAEDEDNPGGAQAFTVARSRQGALAQARRLGGARQLLDLAFDGSRLYLLTGGSPPGTACCSSVRLVPGAGRTQTIISTLAGGTVGRLVLLPRHGVLAALATARGVWVWQSGKARRLTPASAGPQTLAATGLPTGRSAVAWTGTNGQAGAGNPRSIMVAAGSAGGLPGSPHVAAQAGAGHQVDELQMAGPTLAWIESWTDGQGAFHSTVVADDLGHPRHARSFAGGPAAGLAFAADSRGDLLLAWKACDQLAACTVYAAGRPAGGHFGSAQALGRIDASESPAAAVRRGASLVAWVADGHVYAAQGRRSFAAASQVSETNYASNPTLAFAPNGAAIMAWTQGTLNTSLMGAVHHPG